MSTIMSVNGPIEADQLGFTLIHEHIFLDLRNDVWLGDRMLNDTELAYEELMRYKNAGGVTLVDQTSGGLRGNKNRILPIKHPLAIREMSQRTGLHVILGCGWYREPYYEEYLHRAKTDEIAEEIVQEVEVGIEGTDVRAGFIGEIGSHSNYISAVEERVFRAAARAQIKTGLSLTTHQSEGDVALDQLDILEHEGVDLRRVICSHIASGPSHEYAVALARRGAYFSIEGIGSFRPRYQENVIQRILDVVEEGYIDHMMLSHDVCMQFMYTANGGGGYDYISTTWLPLLKERGLSDEQLHRMMVDNPRRALTGER